MSRLLPYTAFASHYDSITGIRGLRSYAPSYQELIKRCELSPPGLVLDVACGTGLWARRLAVYGWRVVAVDRSEAMLNYAQKQCSRLPVTFIRADLRELPFAARFDLITCTYDSLNYLIRRGDLSRALLRFRWALRSSGAAVFDLNTAVAMSELWGSEPLVRRTHGAIGILTPAWNRRRQIGTLRVELFSRARGSNNLYRRVEEVHVQRAYHPETLRQLAHEAGFASLEAFDLLDGLNPVNTYTAKVVYIARPPK